MHPQAQELLSRTDPRLAALIQKVGPMDLKPRRLPPYRSLMQAVVYQQLNGKAAETILRRFIALFPGGKPFPKAEQVLEMPQETLRSAGLSRSKANYLQCIAETMLAGQLPSLAECDRITDEEIVQKLTQIKGVGRWTVEMFLIFNLGRPDVLPVHDLGVRRGYQLAFQKRQLPTPIQLERIGQKWAPYRTAAAWYLWRAADGTKD
jgi:DNA-3-methyladenine glycosylase II